MSVAVAAVVTATKPPRICWARGCDREVIARGLCMGHYQRSRRYGDVLAALPLKPGEQSDP